jgi:mono/diheme cytochrome c family protein
MIPTRQLCRIRFSAVTAAAVFLAAAAHADPAPSALVQLGAYLAAAGGCVSCHTRSVGEPFAGGVRLDTPFGVIYTANITPDVVTGIGAWTLEQFTRAMREGVAADGKQLYPAFPYTAYTKLRDADIGALYVYLRSLRPVHYRPPDDRMRFPFGMRPLVGGWKLLYLRSQRFVPDKLQTTEWNRGAYLIEGLGHCGACHTPRDALGGERVSQALAGGRYLDQIVDEVVDGAIVPLDERTVRPWSAPNLTSSPNGLGAWSLTDIVAYLKTGHSARAGAFGPMGQVIANSTSRLSDADVRAMAVYLKSLPPASQGRPVDAADTRFERGEVVYTTRCGDCHLPSGLGVPREPGADASKAAPPLAGSAALQSPDPATLINVVLYGAHAPASTGGAWPAMSGFELSVGLDDEQIAALCTYVRSSWGNRAGPVDAAAVAAQH